jgi:hypothetical protein
MIPDGPLYDVLAGFVGILLLGAVLLVLWKVWCKLVDQYDGYSVVEHTGAEADSPAIADLPEVAPSPLPEGPSSSWREAEPGETPRTVEPDDAPAPVFIAQSPLRRRFRLVKPPVPQHDYIPRHLAEGERDPYMLARLQFTQEFQWRIEHETGVPLRAVGPREADLELRRSEWSPQSYSQPTLIEVAK